MPENYVVSYQNEEMQLGLTTGVGSQTQKDATFSVKNQERGKPY